MSTMRYVDDAADIKSRLATARTQYEQCRRQETAYTSTLVRDPNDMPTRMKLMAVQPMTQQLAARIVGLERDLRSTLPADARTDTRSDQVFSSHSHGVRYDI